MILRDYQQHALESMLLFDGCSGLVAIPTGGGKTNIFLSYLKKARFNRALILCHRKSLVSQISSRFDMGVGQSYDSRITATTTQLLHKDERLAEYLSHGAPDIIILDEAHRAMTTTFLYIYRRVKEVNSSVRLFGFTATPVRTDMLPLAFVFSRVVFQIDLSDLIRRGYLAHTRQIDVSMDRTIIGGGSSDYTAKQVCDALGGTESFVVETAAQYNRPTIAFTGTVEQAEMMSRHARRIGLRAEAVHYKSAKSSDEVAELMRNGKLDFVSNPLMWIEGIDVPRCSLIAWARPTTSLLTFAQAAGRAMRLHESKQDAIILSFNPKSKGNLARLDDIMEYGELLNPSRLNMNQIEYAAIHSGVR